MMDLIHSLIGIEHSGKVTYISSHFDGQPNITGKILRRYYTERRKVEKLIAHGDITMLRPNIDGNFEKDSQIENYKKLDRLATPRAYRKDLNKIMKTITPKTISLKNYNSDLGGKHWAEWMYLYKDGKWTWQKV